jgi:hypothetical protein
MPSWAPAPQQGSVCNLENLGRAIMVKTAEDNTLSLQLFVGFLLENAQHGGTASTNTLILTVEMLHSRGHAKFHSESFASNIST